MLGDLTGNARDLAGLEELKALLGVNDMAEQHEKTLVPQIRFAGFTEPLGTA